MDEIKTAKRFDESNRSLVELLVPIVEYHGFDYVEEVLELIKVVYRSVEDTVEKRGIVAEALKATESEDDSDRKLRGTRGGQFTSEWFQTESDPPEADPNRLGDTQLNLFWGHARDAFGLRGNAADDAEVTKARAIHQVSTAANAPETVGLSPPNLVVCRDCGDDYCSDETFSTPSCDCSSHSGVRYLCGAPRTTVEGSCRARVLYAVGAAATTPRRGTDGFQGGNLLRGRRPIC